MSEQDTTGYWADGYSEGVKSGYRAGLAEGFARGTRAAAELLMQELEQRRIVLGGHQLYLSDGPLWDRVDEIRALRPEEGK